MIKMIEIKNFRSWEEVYIELSTGINVFIGDSAQGKSNINRALDLVINNRPSGDSYRSHWAIKQEEKRGKSVPTIASIETTDGYIVERIKSKTDNIYVIEKEGKREELKAFGANVPEEVSRILNIQDINTQFQLDPPFLLGSKSVEVARYLNKLADLSVIDTSYTNINKMRIEVRNDLDYSNKEIKNKENELNEYLYLEKAEDKLNKLEAISTRINGLDFILKELTNIIGEGEKNERLLGLLGGCNDALININILEKKVNILNRNKSDLVKSIDGLNTLITQIETQKGLLNNMHIDIEAEMKELSKLEAKYNKVNKLLSDLDILTCLVNEIEKLERDRSRQEINIIKLEKELKVLMPKECPIYNRLCPLYEKGEVK